MTAPGETTALPAPAGGHPELRAELERAGFALLGPDALPAALFQELVEEARRQRERAWSRPSGEAGPHNARRAELGPAARAYLGSPATLALMRDAFGTPLAPSFEASCFTYYEGAGDFMDAHRDRPRSCECTLLLYLEASWPEGAEPGPGLELHVFGDDPAAPAAVLPTRANSVVLGKGSEWAHARPELRDGERVVALTACFARAGDAPVPVWARGPLRGGVDSQSAGRARRLAAEGFDLYAHGLGDAPAARAAFEDAVAADPDYDMGWAGLGFVDWVTGRFEESHRDFVEAARRNPYDPSHWANIGGQLRELRRFEESMNAFSVALCLQPEYAPAWNEWGNVLHDLGRYHDALPYYQRSLGLDPSRAVVHHNLGVCYGSLGQRDLAWDCFQEALNRDPTYHHSLEELGRLLADAGDAERARECFARAGTERAAALAREHGLEAPAS